jgi:hypothetical protein
MTSTDVVQHGKLIRRVKVGLGRYASLYRLGRSFYVVGDRLIDFGSHLDRATCYLELIEADV